MQNQLAKLKSIYREYPRAFWIYNIIVFIDRFGGFMLYPFFALYLTEKYDIGMDKVGLVFMLFSVSGFIGSALGGAITDRMGRKIVIMFSLVLSAVSALAMAFSPTLAIFMAISVIVGILQSIGHPAHEAVVADLLPPEKRAEGYGIIRVIFNSAVIIAPAVGGLLIARSYLLLFIVDAIISLIAAAIVLLALPETKPQSAAGVKDESMGQTFKGYGRIFKDVPFVAFVVVSVMMTLVYTNMNTTLGVFLRDEHTLPETGYGLLLSLNAVIVVLLQIWLTRRLERNKPMLMMALGSAFYAVGFAMYGFVSGFVMFAVAMVVITIGEMIVTPFQQSLVASFAPEEMRGRYMAVSGLSWGLSFAIGPWLAGLLMEHAHPSWLWIASGLVGVVATIGFYVLDRIHHSPIPVSGEPAAAD
jgi:predicted MFS family arabinose efflux permease